MQFTLEKNKKIILFLIVLSMLIIVGFFIYYKYKRTAIAGLPYEKNKMFEMPFVIQKAVQTSLHLLLSFDKVRELIKKTNDESLEFICDLKKTIMKNGSICIDEKLILKYTNIFSVQVSRFDPAMSYLDFFVNCFFFFLDFLNCEILKLVDVRIDEKRSVLTQHFISEFEVSFYFLRQIPIKRDIINIPPIPKLKKVTDYEIGNQKAILLYDSGFKLILDRLYKLEHDIDYKNEVEISNVVYNFSYYVFTYIEYDVKVLLNLFEKKKKVDFDYTLLDKKYMLNSLIVLSEETKNILFLALRKNVAYSVHDNTIDVVSRKVIEDYLNTTETKNIIAIFERC